MARNDIKEVRTPGIPPNAVPNPISFEPWISEKLTLGMIDVASMKELDSELLRKKIRRFVHKLQFVTPASDLVAAIKSESGGLAGPWRIVRQSLSIEKFTIIGVQYEYVERPYLLWLVGKELKVFAPQSPITEFAETLVNEALKCWGAGNRKAAAALTRQVWEMVEKDSFCDLGPRLPLALKAYTWSHGFLRISRWKNKTAPSPITELGSETLYPQPEPQSLPLAIATPSDSAEPSTYQISIRVGSLTVMTPPAGWLNKPVRAKVYIDQELRGTVTSEQPFCIELLPKTYLVKVILEGSVTFRKGVKSVLIVADKISVFTITSNGKLTHRDGPKTFGN